MEYGRQIFYRRFYHKSQAVKEELETSSYIVKLISDIYR